MDLVDEVTRTNPGSAAGAIAKASFSGPSLGLAGKLGPLAVNGAVAAGRLLERCVTGGTLVVEEGDRRRQLGSGEPKVNLTIHDERAYATLFGHGSVGLGESYVAGWWDTDDLTGLVRILLRSSSGYRRRLDTAGATLSRFVSPVRRLRAPSKRVDRQNVQAHYDLPGELFELMLDETMTYSCAIFERPSMSLAEAQRAKLDRLCRKLCLGRQSRLVEIGSGWGGLAIHAALYYGCEVTTTTVSDAQRELATKRVLDAGVGDRVTVLGLDYRDLPGYAASEGRFDRLVSVEMLEAVDWRRHDEFFATCASLLEPDGLMALQAITIDDRSYERAKHHDDFIRRMIFPGGCLPSLGALSESVGSATDLTIVDVEDIGRHYAETLARWRDNLDGHWDQLYAAGLDEHFSRLWELYLSYCEAAFLERHISDVQIVLAKPRWQPSLTVRES